MTLCFVYGVHSGTENQTLKQELIEFKIFKNIHFNLDPDPECSPPSSRVGVKVHCRSALSTPSFPRHQNAKPNFAVPCRAHLPPSPYGWSELICPLGTRLTLHTLPSSQLASPPRSSTCAPASPTPERPPAPLSPQG